jgi:hypothetical protein
MSYFFTITGTPIDISEFSPFGLVPASAAQSFIRKLGKAARDAGNGTMYLVHDGVTGTSHEILVGAEDEVINGVLPEDTTLVRMVRRFLLEEAAICIWWAGNLADPIDIVQCSSPDDVIDVLARQLGAGDLVGVEFTPVK